MMMMIKVYHFQCLMTRLFQTFQSVFMASCKRLRFTVTSIRFAASRAHRILYTRLGPVNVLLLYFISNSIVGFLFLRRLGRRPGWARIADLDLLFTSVSAATVSSMSTVSMEELSNGQLVVVALLMFAGSEMFTSLVHLHMLKTEITEDDRNSTRGGFRTRKKMIMKMVGGGGGGGGGENNDEDHHVVLEMPAAPTTTTTTTTVGLEQRDDSSSSVVMMKQRSALTLLTMVILGVIAFAHLFGFLTTLCYLSFVSKTAKDVLQSKGIQTTLYASFVTISSLSNCGFVPTKEGMVPFKNNSGLLLLLTPLLLAGNTLFPPCLRSALWVVKKLMVSSGGSSREMEMELDYIMSDEGEEELMFCHLLAKKKSICLIYTVLGFVLVQLLICCFFEWHSNVLMGMSGTQKIVALVFQSVNSRHAGLSTFDLSAFSTAIIVMYIAMMYLPPYTMFFPVGEDSRKEGGGAEYDDGDGDEKVQQVVGGHRLPFRKSLVMSNTAHVAIFIFLVCITERQMLSNDPLNFNVLSITTEVVSAFGNVGFSMGYRCDRQLPQADDGCKDGWFGFAGMWSAKGKVLLMLVMFLGRMKRFNSKGGRAWET